jgi:hypothetical protein
MGEWVIPVELETGIPLVIEPRNDLPPVGLTGRGANSHHSVYPRSRDEVQTATGKAVRAARGQWVAIKDHNLYHDYCDEYIAETWDFPTSADQQFGMTVLLAGGYVPEVAVTVNERGISYTHLNEHKREQMWKRGTIKILSEFIVVESLTNYMLEQDLGSAPGKDIEQFILTEDVKQRLELGDQLLRRAALSAAEGVRPFYIEAYKKKLIRPDLPPEPEELIIDAPRLLMGIKGKKQRAQEALRRRLAEQNGIALPKAA